MRVLKILGITLAVLFALPLIWWGLVFATHGNWNKTYATLETESDRAVVHGYTASPLTGWSAHLVWKRHDDKWYVYYLNHEAYFDKYELRKGDVGIEVLCNGILIGKLDTTTAKFFHIKQNLLYEKPGDVIHTANMGDREKWLRWNQADW